MNNNSSQLVKSLEDAWSNIQKLNTETPDVIMTVGTRGRRINLLGHFCPNSWHIEPEQFGEPADESTEKTHEVLIVAEALDRGARDVFNTLLHESIHAIANKRNIKDTSNKIHNKKFRAIAQEMGMYYEGSRDPKLGYSNVQMLKETELLFESSILDLERALKLYRRPELVLTKANVQKKYYCGCDRTLSISKKTHDAGPIVCGLCGSEFEPED